MPSNLVKSYAKKSGKSIASVESAWKKAKRAASKSYDPETNPNAFYGTVNKILRRKLNLEEDRTTKRFAMRRMNESADEETGGRRMSNIFKVNKNKLAEWMADILPELANNEGETAWFELFRDYDEGRTYSVVMTQRDSEDEEIGNEVVAKVASIADNSGMSEYDIDFEMPYDEKTGDVWDTELSIAPVSDIDGGKTSVSYVKGDSDWLADQAEKIFKFIKKTHKSAELEDLQESARRPRSRMLKESRIDWSRMPTIPQEQIDAVEEEIRQKYNTWDERTQESADMVLNALDCVNDEIESCKANKDLGEDLELIVNVIRGGGYSEISLLDLDNEIDASALEDFISDVLNKNESRRPRGRMLRESADPSAEEKYKELFARMAKMSRSNKNIYSNFFGTSASRIKYLEDYLDRLE